MDKDKKYKVFISSTLEDLIEERHAARDCLLANNCIPVAMEQFPASNMTPMDYIRKKLDDCDYYILILGGRYGSLDSDGIGFTEKEYDYAVSQNIPTLCFVYRDPENLSPDRREIDGSLYQKFTAFRNKVRSNKLVNQYSAVDELKAAIATSIHQCIQDNPARGWAPVDSASSTQSSDTSMPMTPTMSSEFAALQSKLDEQAKSTTAQLKQLEHKIDSMPRLDIRMEENDAGGNTLTIDYVHSSAVSTLDDRIAQALDARTASDDEVQEMLDSVFGE